MLDSLSNIMMTIIVAVVGLVVFGIFLKSGLRKIPGKVWLGLVVLTLMGVLTPGFWSGIMTFVARFGLSVVGSTLKAAGL